MRLLSEGEYHYNGDSDFIGAKIVGFNVADYTVNIRAYDSSGEVRKVLNVPLEQNADDGVHYFRPFV